MLEEVTRHNVKSHDRQHSNQDTQTLYRRIDKSRSIARAILAHKHSDNLMGEYLTYEESERSGSHRPPHRKPHSLQGAVILTGTIVISHNGLHTLREAQHDHSEEERHTIGNTVGSDREVATISLQRCIDEDNHHAGTRLNHKRSHTDGCNALD